MAEGLTAGDWFGSAIIRKLVDNACFIKEADHFDLEIQIMLHELQSILRDIQAWIEDAERGLLIRDPAQSILLRQLREAFYEADDLLDEFDFRIISTKMNGDKEVMNGDKKVRRFLSFFVRNYKDVVGEPIRSSDDLRNLTNLVQELQRISFYARHNLVWVDNSEKQITDFGRISTSFQPDIIIGREKEKEEIVSILLSSGGRDKGGAAGSCGGVIDVLPLVGMGGLGKTTLAQLVYNDERVKMHFDTRAWCYVSDDFDIQRISKELLSFLSDDLSDTISDLETIIMKLKFTMSNKKCFIVFDDVWDETPARWEMLCDILICGARGSKVLVTTRSARVADIMRTMSPIMLRCLSEDECWSLFKLCAFGDGNLQDEKREELQYIGMRICRKLGGLPSAAKVLGSRLRAILDENYWRAILESELWEQDFASEGVLSTLKLSYRQLNANLRECFSYCSIFPRGYMFEKHKLVQMWLAQGYIKLDDQEEMTLEDICSQWFDELVHRSFFQPAKENRYVLHDLMHDLAVSISLDDCCVVEDESENVPRRVRHLGVWTDRLEVLKEMIKFKRLHTLLFFGNYDSPEFSEVLEDLFIYLKGLRVLDLSSTPIEKLPDSFGGLLHLRWLDISNTKIRLLPTSFSRLCHLQVLNLQGCHFQELPKDMNKLINLRYLYGGSEIVSLIKGIGELTNLHYLEEFPVRQERGHGIGELKNLNLRGRLSIKNLENVETEEEAMKAELKKKMHLNALQVEWSPTPRNQRYVEALVLEGLEPHPNLKELSITGYDGLFCPHWMLRNQCLINLVCIHLRHCHRWEELPSFGQLPSLRILHFEDMPALTQIGDQFYGKVDVVFPSLEKLTFLKLENLKEWSGIDCHLFFPCLREIMIGDCCSLTECPFLSIHSSVKVLEIDRCGDLGIVLPGCLHSFTSLTSLWISQYHYKTSISLSNLNALETLFLVDCPELCVMGGFHSLVNLKQLHIERCPMLNDSSFPKQPDMEKGLQSLTDLYLDDSILLNDGWVLLGSLPSLRILNFWLFDHLSYFSKEQELWFRQLTSIQELRISHCHNLERLPAELSMILSLKKLSITGCPKIMSLPENGLPISLEELQIFGCPALKERCSREDGPDWRKIKHIPHVRIM